MSETQIWIVEVVVFSVAFGALGHVHGVSSSRSPRTRRFLDGA